MLCTLRDSNPRRKNGSLPCYPYTKGAIKLISNTFLNEALKKNGSPQIPLLPVYLSRYQSV